MADENKPLAEMSAGRSAEVGIDEPSKEREKTSAGVVEEVDLAPPKRSEGIQIPPKEELERSGKEVVKAEDWEAGSEERELGKQEGEWVEGGIKAQRDGGQTAGASASNLKAGARGGKVEDDTDRARRIIGETGEADEDGPIGAEIGELEERQSDEQDLKNAGYDPRDGQSSATIALSAVVRNRQDLRLVRLLLAKGANPALCIVHRSGPGRGALHVAAEVGYGDAVDIFIESGTAELEIVDNKGSTALNCAAWRGHEAVVDMLLAKGAKIETKDTFGRTPLMGAAFYGHEAVARLLLAKGAEPNITDNLGHTALTYAAQYGYEEIVRLFLTNGAQHDIVTNNGSTALILAAENSKFSVMRLLHAHAAGLDPSVSPGPSAAGS